MDKNQQQNIYPDLGKNSNERYKKFLILRILLGILLLLFILFLAFFFFAIGDVIKCAKEVSGPCTTAGPIGYGILFAFGLFGAIIAGSIHSITSLFIRKYLSIFEKISSTIIVLVTIGFILFFCWWILNQ